MKLVPPLASFHSENLDRSTEMLWLAVKDEQRLTVYCILIDDVFGALGGQPLLKHHRCLTVHMRVLGWINREIRILVEHPWIA